MGGTDGESRSFTALRTLRHNDQTSEAKDLAARGGRLQQRRLFGIDLLTRSPVSIFPFSSSFFILCRSLL